MAVIGYDRLAAVYDHLAHLVFGNNLLRASVWGLSEIQTDDEVLLIGGGTGKVLPFIPAERIDFLDVSQGMIKRAASARSKGMRWFQEDLLQWNPDCRYDWVLCPFFLDQFSDPTFLELSHRLARLVRPQGKLVVTDFASNGWHHELLIRSMYTFFRATTNIEAKRLPNFSVLNNDWATIERKRFCKGLIFSEIFSIKGHPQENEVSLN